MGILRLTFRADLNRIITLGIKTILLLRLDNTGKGNKLRYNRIKKILRSQ